MDGRSFSSAQEAIEFVAEGLLKQIDGLRHQLAAHRAVTTMLIGALRKHDPDILDDLEGMVSGWQESTPQKAGNDKERNELKAIGEMMRSIVFLEEDDRPGLQVIPGGKE